MDAETKTCSKCGVVKPVDAFYPRHNQCKACFSAVVKAWQETNSEKCRVAKNKFKKANPEKIRASGKAHREANHEKVSTTKKEWKKTLKAKSYERAYNKYISQTLDDKYVKHLLTKRTPIKDVPQSLIDLKREQVATLREVKRLIKVLKEKQDD